MTKLVVVLYNLNNNNKGDTMKQFLLRCAFAMMTGSSNRRDR